MGPLSVCLSVTLVYCGQTVRWIKMPLGTDVGLDPGNIVLDGDPAPPRKGAQKPPPHFSSHVYCGQVIADLSNCWALVWHLYRVYRCYPVLVSPVKNWRILLEQSFTAYLPFLRTACAYGLGKRCWSSAPHLHTMCLYIKTNCTVVISVYHLKMWTVVNSS